MANTCGYGCPRSRGRPYIERAPIRISNSREKMRLRIPAARCVRVMQKTFRPRGRGECRVPAHPQPRVQCRKHTSVVTTSTPETPGIPAREWFYGFLRALPGDRAFLSPSSAEIHFRQLDAGVEASGPHDFAVRASAVRQERCRVHRIPCPTSVTIAKRPSQRGGDGERYRSDLAKPRTEIFLQTGLDR